MEFFKIGKRGLHVYWRDKSSCWFAEASLLIFPKLMVNYFLLITYFLLMEINSCQNALKHITRDSGSYSLGMRKKMGNSAQVLIFLKIFSTDTYFRVSFLKFLFMSSSLKATVFLHTLSAETILF